MRCFTRPDSHFAARVQCVEQLQCVTWPDMEAPKDTCSLLDLIDYTVNQNLLSGARDKVLYQFEGGGAWRQTRHSPGPLQCRGREDGNLHCPVQTHPGLPERGRECVLHCDSRPTETCAEARLTAWTHSRRFWRCGGSGRRWSRSPSSTTTSSAAWRTTWRGRATIWNMSTSQPLNCVFVK